MADEENEKKNQSSAASESRNDDSEASESANAAPARKEAASRDEPSPDARVTSRATEKPVLMGSQPTTTEYIVTVDNASGLPVKIEKLDDAGKRQELSTAEYARVYGADPAQAAAFSTADATSAIEAYYRGVVDYLTVITRTY